jgi:cell division protein ZapA (FtsZ GTPase activity inhibitor)
MDERQFRGGAFPQGDFEKTRLRPLQNSLYEPKGEVASTAATNERYLTDAMSSLIKKMAEIRESTTRLEERLGSVMMSVVLASTAKDSDAPLPQESAFRGKVRELEYLMEDIGRRIWSIHERLELP